MELTLFLIKAFVYVIVFGASLYALSSLNFEKLIRKNMVAQAQLLYIFLAMCMAYLVGSFIFVFFRNF
ncbi:MAG: DUF1146 domain-containing protein [Solobacterium sp.]|nr:DUF1146 domain-containing protein [Solobacterium sp.]